MNILHISDTHGREVKLDTRGDIVVHSGDLMDNVHASRAMWHSYNEAYQNQRLAHDAKWLKRELGGRPLLLVPGNHDYYTEEGLGYLRDAGIDLHFLCDSGTIIDGVRFWGFPWTPTFYDWNWMCSEEEIDARLGDLLELEREGLWSPDVLVTHGPTHRILDATARGEYCGSRGLRKYFDSVQRMPKAHLFGHIHEQGGSVIGWGGGRGHTQVSNAACSQNLVTI